MRRWPVLATLAMMLPTILYVALLAACDATSAPVGALNTGIRAAAVATATSTASPTPRPTATATPDPPATLRIALPGLPDTLNPIKTGNDVGQAVAALVAAGLTRPGIRGNPEPDLAQSWEYDPVGGSWTFHIRPDARWHDGVAVTAADVVFTLGQVRSRPLGGLWDGIRAEELDPSAVRFYVPLARMGTFLALTSLPLLPSHLLAAGGEAWTTFERAPIGAGPFRVTAIDARGAQLERRSPRTPGGANIATVTLAFTSGPDAELPLLRSGAVDLATIPRRDAANAATSASITLWRPLRATQTMLLLNSRSAVLRDVRVRQALWLATDRNALVLRALGGLGQPSADPLALQPDGPLGTARVPTVTPDREGAGALLDAAGWTLGDTGLRQQTSGRTVQPLRLTILTTSAPDRLAVAQELSSQYRTIGIDVTVQQVGMEGLIRDFLATGAYDATVVGVAWGLPDQQPGRWWRAPQGATDRENFTGLADEQLEASLAAAEAQPDPALRAQQFAAFRTRFSVVVPAIPLYQPVWLVASTTRLTGMVWGWTADAGDLMRGVTTWRLNGP